MAAGTKVVCQQCGQPYMMTKVFNPWPPCPQCRGTLRPAQPDLGGPLGGVDLNAISDRAHPLNADPLAKPVASQKPTGLPMLAWIAIGGGGFMVALIVFVVVGVWMFRGRATNVTAMNPPPVSMPQPPVRPVPTAATPRPVRPPVNFPPSTISKPASVPNPFEATEAVANDKPSTVAPPSGRAGTLRSANNQSLGIGFGGSGSNEEAFQPRTPWKVELDPPQPIEYPATTKPLEIDFKTRVDQLVFPQRASPYFAAANDDYKHKEVRIFDLRTGRSSRKIPGELNNDKQLSAISADGEQMATVVSRNGTAILIADTKSGDAIHSIAVEEKSYVKEIAFAGPGRFLAVVQNNSGSDSVYRVGVWDMSNGEAITDFTLENPVKEKFGRSYYYREGSLGISPGGKYVLFAVQNVVSFFEVETGKLAGELQVTETDRSLDYPSFAFSADGAELTLLTGSRAEDGVLYRIDVTQGELLGSAKINVSEFKDAPTFHQNLGRLQYLSTLDCYLIDGGYVVERTGGEALYRIDAFQGMARVVDGKKVVGVVKRDNAAGLAEFRLPTDEIEKLAAVLKGGGKLLDGIWGEAKSSDLQGVRVLEEPLSAVDWNVAFAPPPEKTLAKKTLTLPVPVMENRYGSSWNLEPPLFSASGNKIAWMPWNERMHTRLNVIDVATAAVEGNIDMLPGSRALDISPDGSLVIAALGKKQFYGGDAVFERLEVFSMPLKKHVLAWQLHLPVANDSNSRSNSENPRLFRKAYFIEKTLVLTKMDGGRHILWKLPDAKPEWVLEGNAEIAAFTPDRSHALLHFRNLKKFSWLELRTGRWCGDLPADDVSESKLAFSPDHKHAAVLLGQNGYSRLVLREVGKETPDTINLPRLTGPLNWLDDRYLISLNDGVVIDSENGVPIWRVQSGGKVFRAPDGNCWYNGGDSRAMQLTKISFPSDSLRAKLKSSKGMPISPLVGPGSRVAVRAGFITDEASARELDSEFQRRGWIRDDAAPYALNAATSQQPSRSETYTNLLSRQTTTVNIAGATLLTITLTDAAGEELWKTVSSSGGGYAPHSVTLRQGEDLQSKIGGGNSGPPRAQLSSIPDLIFPRDPFRHLGQSQLNDKGEKF